MLLGVVLGRFLSVFGGEILMPLSHVCVKSGLFVITCVVKSRRLSMVGGGLLELVGRLTMVGRSGMRGHEAPPGSGV